MPLTKPALARVLPGMPITVVAWNGLVAGIEAVYDGLGTDERAHVEVAVSARGQTLADARVVAVALNPTGPSLAAASPAGDGTAHTLSGLRPGSWRVAIEARGFASQTRDVQVPAAGGAMPALAVELARTTVPAPDLVGLPVYAAQFLLGWAHLPQGDWEPWQGSPGFLNERPVIMQGPSGVRIAAGTAIDALYAGSALQVAPSRIVVPDFLGWPAAELQGHAAYFQLPIAEDDTPTPDARVVSQSIAPGQVVAPGTALHVHYVAADRGTLTFGQFPGTHAALAKLLVKDAVTALAGHATLTAYGTNWTPWPIARTYAGDDYLKELLDVFAGSGLGAKVADRRVDLEAIWRSFVVATHWSTT